MSNLEATETIIPGVMLLRPRVFKDNRGFFLETFRSNTYKEFGVDADFVQHNHSRSLKGTLRGIHYQDPYPQGKLIRVVRGEIYDVAVDLRKKSKTYGKCYGTKLNDENCYQLWIPPGLGHGFYVLSEIADIEYMCIEYYNPNCEHTLRWDDPDLAIGWPLQGEPILSEKDKKAPLFQTYLESN